MKRTYQEQRLFIAPADLAARWGCTRQGIHNLVRARSLPSFAVSSTIRIPLDFVLRKEAEATGASVSPAIAPDMIATALTREQLAVRWDVDVVTIRGWVERGLLHIRPTTAGSGAVLAEDIIRVERDGAKEILTRLAAADPNDTIQQSQAQEQPDEQRDAEV